MVHLWNSKAREETDKSKSVPGMGVAGDIAVVVDGKKLDHELVRLACLMAKSAKRKVHLVHIIEVPRTLPLKAALTKESEDADKLLMDALKVAEDMGMGDAAVAEVVQSRDAGSAIVDEAKDHCCALIMLGLVRNNQKLQDDQKQRVQYVLANAPCRVWLVQDPVQQGT